MNSASYLTGLVAFIPIVCVFIWFRVQRRKILEIYKFQKVDSYSILSYWGEIGRLKTWRDFIGDIYSLALLTLFTFWMYHVNVPSVVINFFILVISINVILNLFYIVLKVRNVR